MKPMNRSPHGLRAVLAAAAILAQGTHVWAQPYIVITTPVDGSTNSSLTTVSGWTTNASGPVSNVKFTLHELDPSGGAGRYWNGSAWQGPSFPLATTITAVTNWTKAASVTLPPLNSGISYQIIATATDAGANTGIGRGGDDLE